MSRTPSARAPLASAREKPLHWVGSAKKDYQGFPADVQSDMGYALSLAQLGGKHSFQKKSKTGIKTPKEDISLVHDRLKAAREHYEQHYLETGGQS